MYSGNMGLIDDSFKCGLISHTVVTVKAAREKLNRGILCFRLIFRQLELNFMCFSFSSKDFFWGGGNLLHVFFSRKYWGGKSQVA